MNLFSSPSRQRPVMVYGYRVYSSELYKLTAVNEEWRFKWNMDIQSRDVGDVGDVVIYAITANSFEEKAMMENGLTQADSDRVKHLIIDSRNSAILPISRLGWQPVIIGNKGNLRKHQNAFMAYGCTMDVSSHENAQLRRYRSEGISVDKMPFYFIHCIPGEENATLENTHMHQLFENRWNPRWEFIVTNVDFNLLHDMYESNTA